MSSDITCRSLALLSVLLASGCTVVSVQTNVPTVNLQTAATPAKAPAPPAPLPEMAGVPALSLTDADVGALPPLGHDYTVSVPMLGRAIALPSGTWRVVSQQKSTFRGYPPGAKVALLRMAGSRMTGVIEIAGNAASRLATSGWPLNPICVAAARLGHDAAVLAGDTRAATEGGDQDCVLVSFQTTASWRDTPQAPMLAALSRSLDHLGVVPPASAVLVAFGETDASSRLTEQLWLNPDLAGIAPDPEPHTTHNAWDAPRLKHDARRRAYVRHLVAWAQGWRGVVRQALTDPAALPTASVAEIR